MGGLSNMIMAAVIGRARRGGGDHGVEGEGGEKKGKLAYLEICRSGRWYAIFWLGSLRRN